MRETVDFLVAGAHITLKSRRKNDADRFDDLVLYESRIRRRRAGCTVSGRGYFYHCKRRGFYTFRSLE